MSTDIEQQARELLDARVQSVRAVVTAQQRVTDLRADLSSAEREAARAYKAALNDGWTAAELKKLGITEPDKPARKPRTTARASTGNGTPTA